MKLCFNFVFTNPDGTPLPDQTKASSILCNSLASSSQTKNITKLWGWVVALAQEKPIEVDEQDYRTLVELIEQNPNLSLLAKAQLLDRMHQCKTNPQPCTPVQMAEAIQEALKA